MSPESATQCRITSGEQWGWEREPNLPSPIWPSWNLSFLHCFHWLDYLSWAEDLEFSEVYTASITYQSFLCSYFTVHLNTCLHILVCRKEKLTFWITWKFYLQILTWHCFLYIPFIQRASKLFPPDRVGMHPKQAVFNWYTQVLIYFSTQVF